MGLMSTLESDWKEGEDLNDAKFGFFGYGSGSKSKCFEGDLQPQWKEVVSNFNVFNRLEKRTAIDYATYENLHCGRQQESIVTPKDEFLIERIGTEGVREGARYYKFAASISVSA
jgi:hydroxymethylglutaryl-CoA synthase